MELNMYDEFLEESPRRTPLIPSWGAMPHQGICDDEPQYAHGMLRVIPARHASRPFMFPQHTSRPLAMTGHVETYPRVWKVNGGVLDP